MTKIICENWGFQLSSILAISVNDDGEGDIADLIRGKKNRYYFEDVYPQRHSRLATFTTILL